MVYKDTFIVCKFIVDPSINSWTVQLHELVLLGYVRTAFFAALSLGLNSKQAHRCQPLRFFRNCYEFRAKITVLRISDYCRPGTVPHLNIIVIIQTFHCLLKLRKDKRLRDFDYLILLGFSGLSIVENDLSISCSIPSS